MNADTLKFVYQHPLFTQEEIERVCAAHRYVQLEKGDFLLKEGNTANEYYIIQSGLVRSYVYDYDGNDITTSFIGNKEVAIEVASIFHRIPTKENLQCLTDCEAWIINFDDFQNLYHSIPALSEWGRAWMSFSLAQLKSRTTEFITEPASKRYLQLVEEKPYIIQQAALKHIASYLGITDTSLSRIRKEISIKP